MTHRVSFVGRGLAIVFLAVAWTGCPSTTGPPQGGPFVWQGAIEPVIIISRDCEASPDVTVIDYQGPGLAQGRTQVVWVVDKNDDETLRITPKEATAQDPGNSQRGDQIRGLFGERFEIPPGAEDAIRSGPPKVPPPFSDGEVIWRYNVEILSGGGEKVCSYDPEVCIRDQGSSGCDYQH